MRIVCVGAGPAGLYFALLTKLDHPDHEVTVFERNRPESSEGWGLGLSGDVLEQLYRSDPVSAGEVDGAAFRWTGLVADVRGKPAVDAASAGQSITRRALLGFLTARAVELGVRIEYAHEVESRSDFPDADLIVAGDGVNSRLRGADAERFGTDIQVGRNKYIWLGTDKVFDSFTFPFVETESGWLWAHAYGIDDHSSTFIVECPPETWQGLGFATASAAASLACLERIFAPHLDGGRLTGARRDEATIPWLNFRRVTNRHWYDGNLVLVGDAAHTTHFAIGSGTKLAIEDAIALAASLDHHAELEPALAAYEAERKAALVQPQSEAFFSALWLENIGRYIDLNPQQFFTLLRARRSSLLPRLPPRLYYWIHQVAEDAPGFRSLGNRLGPGLRALDRRKARAGHGQDVG